MSDVLWTPEERDQEGSNSGSGSGSLHDVPPYFTRQAGKAITVQTVTKVAEWTVPGLPVLTVPLLIGKDECGKLLAISLLGTDEQDDLPAVGPFNLFCRSSCYIEYEDEQHFLLWQWEMMESLSDADASQESSTTLTSSSDEWERSSEGEGDDVVILDEDTQDQEEAAASIHTVGFKVLGVTAFRQRQDMLYAALNIMSQGQNVDVVIKPEPSNPHDAKAIAVVVGVGDEIGTVGYIPKELTKHVHPSLTNKSIMKVAIEHIKFRAFNPPGYYMRLLITKRGRWHNEVVRKSLCTR